MLSKKRCVAMLLAGGQGSRLYPLTKNIAKPAVPFGARYRIIDFSLSNCVNSGIDTVGVLTQYLPLQLNDYLGRGVPWDLNLAHGGLHILPPYQAAKGGDWFKGTANAIYQNRRFIRNFDPDYILVLSGDHIYKMDYSIMLEEHMEHAADCTIAVIDVPLEEAGRFGIMNTDEHGRILEFEEKPAHPKSTQASMGVYIFNTRKLMQYLEADDANPDSSNDFGKDVIPVMLADHQRMFAYLYKGYWRDVGTLQSYWSANMDVVHDVLPLNDPGWRIYYRHSYDHPQYVGPAAHVTQSICGDGNEVYGTVEGSVLFNNITIEEGAEVKDSIIMSNTVIRKGSRVEYTIIDTDAKVAENARIGGAVGSGAPAVIASGVTVGEGAAVPGGAIVTADMEKEAQK